MDERLSEAIAVMVEQRVTESLNELLEESPSYKELSIWAANDSQKLIDALSADIETADLLDEYYGLMLKIHAVENYYTYMLGLKDIKEIENTIGDSTWSIGHIVEFLANEYELQKPSHEYPNSVSQISEKSARTRPKPKRTFTAAIVAIVAAVAFLTGACLPRLYNFMIDGDTLVRQSGMMERPPTEGESFRSIEEAFSYYDLKGAITWIPEEYALDHVEAKDMDGYLSINAWYQSESDDTEGIAFRCIQYQDPKELVERIEIEREGGEEEHANGITYFLTRNKETLRAVWNSDDCLFSLKGNVTEAELQQMIKSI